MRWNYFILALCIYLVLIFSPSKSYATYVSEGRELLFGNASSTFSNLVAANDKFKLAVQDTNSDEANFFYAVTQIPAFFLTTGTNPSAVDSGRELLEAFGFTIIADAGYGYDSGQGVYFVDPPYSEPVVNGQIEIPENAPDGEEIREFLRGPFIDVLDSAISNLKSISSSFRIFLTASETGHDSSLEVDYGDALLLKCLLLCTKAGILVSVAYNINFDSNSLVQKINSGNLGIQRDLIDKYPELLELLPTSGITEDGSALLQQAKTAVIEAIDSYFDASESIRNETDPQGDDIIFIDPEDEPEETNFRDNLLEAKDSLNQGRMAAFSNQEGTKIVHIDANHLFGYTSSIDPLSIRDILPPFDLQNFIRTGTFPDTTLGGILPDCPTEAKLMEFFSAGLPIVFPITRATLIMDGYESDWSGVPSIGSCYFDNGWGNQGNQKIQYIKVAKDSDYLYWMMCLESNSYNSYRFHISWWGDYIDAYIEMLNYYEIYKSSSGEFIIGDFTDFGIGQIIEGRIPIRLLSGRAVFDVYVGAYEWDGWGWWSNYSYLSTDELITSFRLTYGTIVPVLQLLLGE